MRTLTVPAAPTPNPTRLANATAVPLRLVVNVFGGGQAALAYSVNDLTPTVSSEAFQITTELVCILAPQQTLYGVGVGGSVQLTIAASEAYPVI
jgi:hypothetical protein